MPDLVRSARWAAAALLAWPALVQPSERSSRLSTVTLSVELASGESWRAVDPQTVFSSGDVVRFRFTSSFGGYLYVLNRSSAGTFEWLFPSAPAGTQNQVVAGAAYLVPATEGGFRVQGKPGFDTLYWIITPSPLSSFSALAPEDVVPSPPASGAKEREQLLPRCRDDILRARGRCIDDRAGARAPSDTQQHGKALAGAGGLKPRELKFQKTDRGTEINSTAPDGLPFLYEYRLAHR